MSGSPPAIIPCCRRGPRTTKRIGMIRQRCKRQPIACHLTPAGTHYRVRLLRLRQADVRVPNRLGSGTQGNQMSGIANRAPVVDLRSMFAIESILGLFPAVHLEPVSIFFDNVAGSAL